MSKRYSRVILLGVDGAGIFFAQADTPNMDKLFENGAVTYKAITSLPTISAECWGSMLHGVGPEVHKLTNSIVGSTRYDVKSPYPSFFKVIRESYPDAKLVSFCNWDPINYGIIEENLGVHEDTAGDERLTEKIVSYINENDFDTMFIQFDDVDGAGHNFGYGFKQHLERITLTDTFIGKIVDALKARDMFDDTLFIVTADHGGTPTGGHGGSTDAEKIIYMGVAGKGVMKGEISPECPPNVKDLAAIVLYGMGLDIPETWTAKIPANIFEELKEGTENKCSCTTIPDVSASEGFVLRTALTFDGKTVDTTSHTSPIVVGDPVYDDSKIDLYQSQIIINPYKIGVDNFKVCLNASFAENAQGVIFANKDVFVPESYGFAFTVKDGAFNFNVGDGTNAYNWAIEADSGLNDAEIEVTVDRKAQKLILAVNGIAKEFDMDGFGKDLTFDALAFTIGAGAGNNLGNHISMKLAKFEVYR